MKRYTFPAIITVDAESKEEAERQSLVVLDNLREMIGHAPFPCDIFLLAEECEESEIDEDDDGY